MKIKEKISVKLLLSFFFISAALAAFGQQTGLIVTSTAFQPNGMIPAKYSCEGAEVNPPLQVSGIPAAARSLALIVHDPDAPKPGGVTHWVVWNIPVDGKITESFKGGVQGLNSDNKPGYKGMCPPSGKHRYFFRVYALDTLLNISSQSNDAALQKAMQTHLLAEGQLIGVYAKENH